MHVAFDFGISNTDLAIFERESTHFHSFPTDTKDLTKHQIEDILKLTNLAENYSVSELIDSCLSKNKKKNNQCA